MIHTLHRILQLQPLVDELLCQQELQPLLRSITQIKEQKQALPNIKDIMVWFECKSIQVMQKPGFLLFGYMVAH